MQWFAGCRYSGQRDLLSFCITPLKSEDRSENQKESYTKQRVLSFAKGFTLCRKVFFMPPSQDESPTCTDKCSGDLQLLVQWEISYGVASMLVRSLAFLRGLLPCLEHAALLCRRSTALRYLWSPSHPPSAASDGTYLRTIRTPKPPIRLPVWAFASTRFPVGPKERGWCSSPWPDRHVCAFEFESMCFERPWLLLG